MDNDTPIIRPSAGAFGVLLYRNPQPVLSVVWQRAQFNPWVVRCSAGCNESDRASRRKWIETAQYGRTHRSMD